MGPPPPAAPQTRFRADAGLVIGKALGENAADVGISPGIRLGLSYNLGPTLSVGGSLRYVAVQEGEDDDITSYHDFGLGLRYTMAGTGFRPFAEVEVVQASGEDKGDTGSAMGFVGRAGGVLPFKPTMGITGFASYTTVSSDGAPITSGIAVGGGIAAYF